MGEALGASGGKNRHCIVGRRMEMALYKVCFIGCLCNSIEDWESISYKGTWMKDPGKGLEFGFE